MKIHEMKVDVAYQVIKASSDGTVAEGDIIALCSDSSILIWDALGGLGCIDQDDYQHPEVADFECVVDKSVYVYHRRDRTGFDFIPRLNTDCPWNHQLQAIKDAYGDDAKYGMWPLAEGPASNT